MFLWSLQLFSNLKNNFFTVSVFVIKWRCIEYEWNQFLRCFSVYKRDRTNLAKCILEFVQTNTNSQHSLQSCRSSGFVWVCLFFVSANFHQNMLKRNYNVQPVLKCLHQFKHKYVLYLFRIYTIGQRSTKKTK